MSPAKRRSHELRNTELRDVMTPRVLTLPIGEPASDAFALMRDAGVRHAVVLLGSTVVGVISDRDLGGPHGATLRRHRTVHDLMHADPVVAAPDMTLPDAVHLVRVQRLGCLPVVEDGHLIGIVTRSDLLRALDPQAEDADLEPEDLDDTRPEPLISQNRDKSP